jgi:DNA-directed RNA polymerase specialized sigma24 family protein
MLDSQHTVLPGRQPRFRRRHVAYNVEDNLQRTPALGALYIAAQILMGYPRFFATGWAIHEHGHGIDPLSVGPIGGLFFVWLRHLCDYNLATIMGRTRLVPFIEWWSPHFCHLVTAKREQQIRRICRCPSPRSSYGDFPISCAECATNARSGSVAQISLDRPGEEPNDWLDRLQANDPSTWMDFWEQYHKRVRGLARHRLVELGLSGNAAEDVMQEAFTSLWNRVKKGGLKRADSAETLWGLLAQITRRKANKKWMHERAQKRDRSRTQREADAQDPASSPIQGVAGKEASPLDALMAEEFLDLLKRVAQDATEHEVLLLWFFLEDEVEIARTVRLDPDYVRILVALLLGRLRKLRDEPDAG